MVLDGAKAYRLGALVDRLGGELHGDRDLIIEQVAPLETAEPKHVCFVAGPARAKALQHCNAGAVVVGPGMSRAAGAYIVTDNPYAYFIRIAQLINAPSAPTPCVHALASVHPSAQVAASAEISPFVTIGEHAKIGARARIGPGCHIGAHAQIGDDCYLHANVCVYAHCTIGARGVLNAGSVIGSDGFGGAMDAGRWLKMPHIGRVMIGDDVEVGANTTIDRGAMADTVIGEGVKLDNQIQVGHNVRIGAHTSIAGCAGIAGSARIGAYCVIGGGAIVLGHLEIVDRVQISAGTVVTGSIRAAGRYSGIYPIADHRAWLKSAITVRRAGEGLARAREITSDFDKQSEKDDENAN